VSQLEGPTSRADARAAGNAPGREDGWSIDVIDQTKLPFSFEIKNLQTLGDACAAISKMVVRGAPLIGATAAYGFYLAMRDDASPAAMLRAYEQLFATRPTAVNLRWALDRLFTGLEAVEADARTARAFALAAEIAELDEEYYSTASMLRELAIKEYGCADFISLTEGGTELAISYWPSKSHIEKWHKNAEHVAAQSKGKAKWYKSYRVQVTEVKSQYETDT